MKRVARHSIPAAAILLPAAFFLSVLSPDATEPNPLIYLAYVGAVSLGAGLLMLGIGLIRKDPASREG
jgi:predicted DNA repair protein MutK